MATMPYPSKIVIGIHLGLEGAGPSVALMEERRDAKLKFTLRHLFRFPSRVSYGAAASGAAEMVRKQVHNGLDWQLVLGSGSGRKAAINLLREDLWPLVRTVETNRTADGSATGDHDVSGWRLAGTLRSHFETGQLRLASSLLKAKEHVDRLLESLLGPRFDLSPIAASSGEPHLDDLVIAAGLALWWAEQSESPSVTLRPAPLVPRLLSRGDLL